MSISPGTKLGHYEIVSLLGAGGMGEVYQARDTRLGRDVAIKVLPERVAGNSDLLKRFEREDSTTRTAKPLLSPAVLASPEETIDRNIFGLYNAPIAVKSMSWCCRGLPI